MFPILLYITIYFWLASILQASLIPFWAGDLIFIVLFVWGLRFIRNIEKYRHKIWEYWIPPVFGLGMANFLFFSYWILLPYFLIAATFTFLIIRKNKWMFRYKEGLFYCFVVFLIYLAAVLILRSYVFNYALTTDVYVRLIVTLVVSLGAWIYFMVASRELKIR